MKIAATLEYDGTKFSGFQRQKNAITIQQHLEEALNKITNENIVINYSGRTDAGVHAISQVFDFETNISREDSSWIKGINSNLPRSIGVKKIFNVPNSFDSRFSAIERKYSYIIYNSISKPLFFDDYCHWVTNKLDKALISDQLNMFIGTHDFSSFRSSNCNSRNPVKTINNVNLKSYENFIIITVTANAFLQNMVRIMIGTLVDIAKYENNFSVKDILKKNDRSFAGKTAPAKGLFFLGPKYNEINTQTMEKNLLDRFKI